MWNERSLSYSRANQQNVQRHDKRRQGCHTLEFFIPKLHSWRTPKYKRLENWIRKPLHGRYKNIISQEIIDQEASHGWLLSGNLFPETEGFIMEIQNQVLPTRTCGNTY